MMAPTTFVESSTKENSVESPSIESSLGQRFAEVIFYRIGEKHPTNYHGKITFILTMCDLPDIQKMLEDAVVLSAAVETIMTHARNIGCGDDEEGLTMLIKYLTSKNDQNRSAATMAGNCVQIENRPLPKFTEDISKLLHKAEVGNVHIHPHIFFIPLYSNTALERTNQIESPETVYKKNIYYLAKKTVNVLEVVGNLVQRGLMTMDDKDRILMTWDSDLLRAMESFIIAVQKESSKFENLILVFHVTKNVEILEIFNSNMHKCLTGNFREAKVEQVNVPESVLTKKRELVSPSVPPAKIKDGEAGPYWFCQRCTLLNSSELDVCGACRTSKNGGDPAATEAIICEVCGYRL